MQTRDARQRLLNAVGADGGWSYYAGRASRLEPTAWALLALGAAGLDERTRDRAVAFLSGLRRESGLFVDPGAPGANFAWNGLALLALQQFPHAPARALGEQIASALSRVRGEALRPDATIRQDNSLQAWSWTQGTFSWVEPTAYCLLALKRQPGRTSETAVRITEADRLLVDRACRPAGWNYGNGAVLDQDLRPYVPTTALALLALQDRRSEPVVGAGLDWLAANAVAERSSMALSLAAICLTIFGRSADNPVAALAASQEQTGSLDNTHLRAMALFALTLPEHEARAFRI